MTTIRISEPALGPAEKDRVMEVLNDGHIADGPEVRRFENEFADFCHCTTAIATSNGTTALHAALRAIGIGPGDQVITTPFSFVATANAIRHCGATPVFADIDPETLNLDPAAVEETITALDGEVSAILPVHLYGLPADMDRVRELAEKYDLAIVEDAAQAHGAEFRGQPVGSLGDVGCFSFYPTKNMTTGEGGMIVTDRDDVAERARQFINHGRAGGDGLGYEHVDVGHNFRMTSIAAAIGRAQLEKLPQYILARREYANELTEMLRDRPGIDVPIEPADRRCAYHQYTIRCPQRDSVRTRLDAIGISSAVYYPRPIHRQPAYDDINQRYPVAERAAEEVLSLPVHPSLTAEDVRTVAEAVAENAPITP